MNLKQLVRIVSVSSHELGHYTSARIREIDIGYPFIYKVPFLNSIGGGTPIYRYGTKEDKIVAYSWGSIAGLLALVYLGLIFIVLNKSLFILLFPFISEILYMIFGSDSKKIRFNINEENA